MEEHLKLFEHSGMEVYETIGIILVPRDEERSPDRVRAQSLLHLREMQEQKLRQYHAVHDVLRTRGVTGEERYLVVDNWMKQISHCSQLSTCTQKK